MGFHDHSDGRTWVHSYQHPRPCFLRELSGLWVILKFLQQELPSSYPGISMPLPGRHSSRWLGP